MANFLAGVNRVLRINNIIRGDDDAITTFDDTQHSADIQKAQIAIQSELTEIVSESLIPYEKDSETISLVTSTRTYALDAGFIRFYGKRPSFYDSTDNVRIYEYPGGEDALREIDYQYKTVTGTPTWWYWVDTTSKTVGFYNVPSSSYSARSLQYDFETSVMVSDSTDTLPFHNNEEYFSFIDMAARRMKFIITERDFGLLPKDATYANAKSRLYALLRHSNPSQRYGNTYG